MSRGRGFTLIELLVVIAIIGILSSIVLVSVAGARAKAKIGVAQGQLKQIQSALQIMADETGQWPGHQTVGLVSSANDNEVWDLNAAVAGLTKTDGTFPNWHGPYIPPLPLDPWGQPYFFDTDYDTNLHSGIAGVHNAVVLGSFGPNGVGQNVYDSDDIIIVLVP